MNLADLQQRFDDWEEKTRGHLLWPHRVQLEPPYTPLLAERRIRGGIIDDGRRPSFWQRLTGAASAAKELPVPSLEADAAPSLSVGADEITELQLLVPRDFDPRAEVTRRCLESLSFSGVRLSFEIVGSYRETVAQIACDARFKTQVLSTLRAFFPDTRVRPRANDLLAAWAKSDSWIAILELGLKERVFRPLRTGDQRDTDPLIDVVARLGELQEGELGVVQVLFEAARGNWGQDFVQFGRSIEDVDRVLPLMEDKFGESQFAVAIRVAAAAATEERTAELARDLATGVAVATRSELNELNLLDVGDATFESEVADLLDRESHRSGMILSLSELSCLAHLPSAAVRSERFARQATRTRSAPPLADARDVVLGVNEHEGDIREIGLAVDGRLRHTYCIGASGTGKSTLLLSMICQDIAAGRGFGVLDPHGDLIDDVLARIPVERAQDVVLFDPSDEEYPVGFNVLSAHSDLERTLLASDLVGVFKRFSSTFGDQMATVLGNAVLAFLESKEGGTLIDLRNLLIDKAFREKFLRTVDDDEVRSYWAHEFPLLKGSPQASILTRLNTFLRPKTIRYMVAQRRDSLDLRRIMDGKQILLAKLSHGAIGEENAYLLGSLLVARIAQAAMSRQDEDASRRVPFFLYMDEFQHFITPSIASILSGARKYGLGLVLSHQEIRQLKTRSDETLSAVLGNAFTRVVFRVGEHDAKALADGFSHFESRDLQNLGIGEAIVRIERPDYDFNLRTILPEAVDPTVARERRIAARASSRARYATRRAEIEGQLRARVPESDASSVKPQTEPAKRDLAQASHPTTSAGDESLPGRGGRQHKKLQSLIRKLAEDRGFDVRTEETVLDGHGYVDVVVERDGRRVAIEISVSARLGQEVGNLTKCLAAGFDLAVLVCSDTRLLDEAKPELANADGRVRFLTPDAVAAFLDDMAGRKPPPRTARGKPGSVGESAPGKRVMSSAQAADFLGVAQQTLAKMRWSGESPPFMKLGRKVVYDRDELEKWLRDRRRRSTSDPGD